jgi:hypothetical protein
MPPGAMVYMYWMPEETVSWLRRTVRERELWIAMSQRPNALREIDVDEVSAGMLYDVGGDSMQIHLGTRRVAAPFFHEAGGNTHIDPLRSYSIQFVPAVIAPGRAALLEGRSGHTGLNHFEDRTKAESMASLFKELRSSLKKHSDPTKVVVQDLTDGTTKRLGGILVGRTVPSDGLILKQFLRGPVVFRLEPRAATRA